LRVLNAVDARPGGGPGGVGNNVPSTYEAGSIDVGLTGASEKAAGKILQLLSELMIQLLEIILRMLLLQLLVLLLSLLVQLVILLVLIIWFINCLWDCCRV
jgi:hypothetical protein